jgi:hypothetical protein
MQHPTQIFMSNPKALRVEYRLDDQRLILWWSPRAGRSTDWRDRHFSNWQNHLEVFEEITLPGCGLGDFERCDYDPYHCVLHFRDQTLHLALRPDTAAALLWTDRPQAVEIKTHRYDQALREEAHLFLIRHAEPSYVFAFGAALGPDAGVLRHCPFHVEWNSTYTRAELEPGQLMVIGVGLEEDAVGEVLEGLASVAPAQHLEETDAALAPVEARGRVVAPAHPELERLQRVVLRGLHSMIDESATFRASLKDIYYQIWVRDSGFSFAYQAAAGWPHKLRELCRLLLDNPLTVGEGQGAPAGRLFGQMINRAYGKCEEDGLYYVVWTLFTYWTQCDELDFMTDSDWDLIAEALTWVDAAAWDPERGLYGQHWADESPTCGWRDFGWDYAFGKPLDGRDVARHNGQRIARSYDTYFNLIQHSAFTMLAALNPDRFSHLTVRAERLWRELTPMLAQRTDGLPPYGELLLESGERVVAPYWGPVTSVYVWGLTMPCFAPLPDWPQVHATLWDAIRRQPRLHWINGICSTAAAIDPWVAGEEQVLEVIKQTATEAFRPGKFLPMGGAMPEKMDAPQGSYHNDIRPQGFAMGAWLAALASLGVRRLPYGLALRPTRAITNLSAFQWRRTSLDFQFGPTGTALGLEINGQRVPHTLQLPEKLLSEGHNRIRLVEGPPSPLLIRSTVRLDNIRISPGNPCRVQYDCSAFGLAELVFAEKVEGVRLVGADGASVKHTMAFQDHLCFIRFSIMGHIVLSVHPPTREPRPC